jgi:hypothetical protein
MERPGRVRLLSNGPSLWALALACLCLLAGAAAPTSSSAGHPAAWLELAGGSQGEYLWSVEARTWEGPTGAGPPGSRRPCLLVHTGWRSGPLEYHRSSYRQCATGAALRPSGPPLVASGAQPSTGAPARISVVGMVFSPAARRVRVILGGGARRTIPLQRVGRARARASGLGRLRFGALVVHGAWCAERLVSLNASGRVLWDSGTDDYACGSGGDPDFAARSQAAVGLG